jgi:hypothetical protein
MLVLAAMMRHRMESAYSKQNQAYIANGNPGKYDQTYLNNRYTNRRDVAVLAAKFNQAGRRIRIVANAQACYFCWNMLSDLQIECGGLDDTNALNVARGDRPLTGWWNPINDAVYSHGTPPWTNQVSGIRWSLLDPEAIASRGPLCRYLQNLPQPADIECWRAARDLLSRNAMRGDRHLAMSANSFL